MPRMFKLVFQSDLNHVASRNLRQNGEEVIACQGLMSKNLRSLWTLSFNSLGGFNDLKHRLFRPVPRP
jgi:hypothetical protein